MVDIEELMNEVNFREEMVLTASGEIVRERRKTAWQGYEGIGDFQYSGKAMAREVRRLSSASIATITTTATT